MQTSFGLMKSFILIGLIVGLATASDTDEDTIMNYFVNKYGDDDDKGKGKDRAIGIRILRAIGCKAPG